MVVRLNWSKPYAEVYGMPGAVFEQAGHFFKPNGRETGVVDDEPDDVITIKEMFKNTDSDGVCSLENLSELQLRAMVEAFGEDYANREQALLFLKAGSNDVDS